MSRETGRRDGRDGPTRPHVPHLPVPTSLPGALAPAGLLAGVLAAGVAVGVAVQRAALRPAVHAAGSDPALGGLAGTPWTVTTGDGVELALQDDPAADAGPGAPLLLFVHGFALSTDIWCLQRAALRGRFPMTFLDQRGHGRSGMPPPRGATIDRLGRDLGEVLEALAARHPGRRVVLVGHSMGGMATLALARRRPELFGGRVCGVALICSSPGDAAALAGGRIAALGPLDAVASGALALSRGVSRAGHRLTSSALHVAGQVPGLTHRARGAVGAVEAAITRRMSFARPVPADLAAFTGEVIGRTPVSVIAAFYLAFFDLDLLHAVGVLRRVATLVVSGAQDRMIPAAHSAQIADRLPDAEVLVLDPAGHMAFLEVPGAVTDALVRLADRAAATPATEVSGGAR